MHEFVDRLCHDVVGTYCQIQVSQVWYMWDKTIIMWKEPIVPAHLPEHPEGTPSNNRWIVCRENYKGAKQVHPGAKEMNWSKYCKSVYCCKAYKVCSCIGSMSNNCFDKCHLESWILVTIRLTIAPSCSTKDGMRGDTVNKWYINKFFYCNEDKKILCYNMFEVIL